MLFNFFSHYRSKRTLTTHNVHVTHITFSAAVLSYLAVLSATWTRQEGGKVGDACAKQQRHLHRGGKRKVEVGGGLALLLRPRQKRGVVVRVVAAFPTKGKELFTLGKT